MRRRFRLPSTDRMIRTAVVLAIVGMLLLLPILLTISGMAVGLFMLGSLCLSVAIVFYVAAVYQELRRSDAI
jgi:predicted membrane channel-forming protein YqfA (hemolysin III family)